MPGYDSHGLLLKIGLYVRVWTEVRRVLWLIDEAGHPAALSTNASLLC